MNSYELMLNAVLSSPNAQQAIFAGKTDSEIQNGKLRLKETFRQNAWDKKAIEHHAFKGLYSPNKTDEQIYNEAMEIKGAQRLNSDSGLLFPRDLTMVDPRYMEVKKQPLGKWRELLPIQNFEYGVGEIAYRQYEFSGEAQDNSPASNQVPFADAEGKEFKNQIYGYKSGYKYTFSELRKAAFSGANIARSKMTAVERAFNTKLQKGMMFGQAEKNLTGFINAPNVPSAEASASSQSGNPTKWDSTKLPDEVIKDISGMPSAIIGDEFSAYGENGFIICLPSDQYNYVMTTPRTSTSDTTIANYILQNDRRIIGFQLVHELKGQGQGGTDLAICYMKDPEYLEAQVADSIIWQAPQFHGYEIWFPAEMEFGGVAVRYPRSMRQLYGI